MRTAIKLKLANNHNAIFWAVMLCWVVVSSALYLTVKIAYSAGGMADMAWLISLFVGYGCAIDVKARLQAYENDALIKLGYSESTSV